LHGVFQVHLLGQLVGITLGRIGKSLQGNVPIGEFLLILQIDDMPGIHQVLVVGYQLLVHEIIMIIDQDIPADVLPFDIDLLGQRQVFVVIGLHLLGVIDKNTQRDDHAKVILGILRVLLARHGIHIILIETVLV